MTSDRSPNGAKRVAIAAAIGVTAVALLALFTAATSVPVSASLGGAESAPDQETKNVAIGDFYFNPVLIEVSVGDTVRWTNTGFLAHTTKSEADPPLWESGGLAITQSFTHTFTAVGTYDYICEYHPTQMQGQVVVQMGQQTATATPTISATMTVTPTTETPTVTTTVTATTPTDRTPTDTASATPTAGPTVTPLPDGPKVALEEVADGLTSPVDLDPEPEASDRLFVADQTGVIRIIDGSTLLPTPFLDLSDRMVELRENYDERGLLGVAFHPEYADNGKFYVYYSAPLREDAPDDWDHTSHVSEFTVSADPDIADAASERIVMQIDQPQRNHDAGTIAFGPDGYLYVPLGDGGGANDVGVGHPPLGNGQDTSTLLGSILRIDVDGAEPYAVPEDNPFVGGDEVREEIWAYGFRNPYRITFDRMTGDLYVGDAGQNQWEEVDLVTGGSNYGWNIKEGRHCFNPEEPDTSPEICAEVGPRGEPLIDPILEYRNGSPPEGIGLVVVGGYMYRGSAIPELQGRYVFGDWSTSFREPDGTLMVGEPVEDGLWPLSELGVLGQMDGLGSYLLAFGEDAMGELYVLTTDTAGPTGDTGKVMKIVPGGDVDLRIFLPLTLNRFDLDQLD